MVTIMLMSFMIIMILIWDSTLPELAGNNTFDGMDMSLRVWTCLEYVEGVLLGWNFLLIWHGPG